MPDEIRRLLEDVPDNIRRAILRVLEIETHRWRVVARRVTLISLVCIATVVLAIVLQRVQSARDRRQDASVAALATQTARLAKQTARTLDIVVDERSDNIRRTCEDQNARNARTKRRLIKARLDPDAEEFTRSLIDALVPRRDCEALVQRSTGRSTG